jgi:hypothetical protein
VGWVWRDPTCQFIGRDRILRGDLEWGNALDPLQVGLDVVGMVPGFGEPADGLNGGISLLRGDRVGAARSFGSMVPFAGWGATVAKWGRRGMRLGDAGRGVRQAPAVARGLGAVPGGQMPGHAAVPPILAPRRTIDGDAYCSFSGDTDVATAAGDIPISEIEPGDTVLAYDEATGTTDVFTVTATWAHVDPMVTTVTLDGEAIATTSEHPFYVLLKGWVPAGQLQAGDSVRRADGSYGVVADVAHTYEPQVMYNLTVDTAHTFFVGAGAWLVHNTCPEVIQAIHAGLPNRKGTGPTSGYLFDATGTMLGDRIVSGNRISLPPATRQMVRDPFGELPTAGSPDFLHHVESKAARYMREHTIARTTLVINNHPCSGPLSCSLWLKRVLPEDATLRIIVPDGFDARGPYDKLFRGE